MNGVEQGRYAIKLVRDDIAKMEPSCEGHEIRFWSVGQTTHIRLLKQKLLEEVGEYLVEPSLGELADILEAVECLAAVDQGVDFKGLRAEQMCKRRARGSFLRGTVMFSTSPLQGSEEGG